MPIEVAARNEFQIFYQVVWLFLFILLLLFFIVWFLSLPFTHTHTPFLYFFLLFTLQHRPEFRFPHPDSNSFHIYLRLLSAMHPVNRLISRDVFVSHLAQTGILVVFIAGSILNKILWSI